MKLRHISAAVAVAILLPFAASALTADDIQAQIANLLAQISQLQQQLKQIQTTTPVQPPPDIAPNPPRCPIFTRTLAQGTTGDDVTQLQQYLGVSPTGYFGPMTAKAVSAVQADAGISQVGIVGPATRAWFYRRCGGGWNQNFTASPTSGAAPLNVNFAYPYNSDNSAWNMTVSFGDGTSGIMSPLLSMQPCSNSEPCQRSGSWNANHTYAANGTYTATMTTMSVGACSSGTCATNKVLGTVTITVGGSTSNASISVSSPVGGTNVAQGNQLSISWNSQSPPAGSVVGLWLIRTRPTGEVQLGCPDSNDPATLPCGSINLGLIATRQPTSGSYTWTVPAAAQTTSGCASGSAFDCIQSYGNYVSPCPQDAAGVCGSNITAGSYQIVAKLYTPADACLGGLCWPNSAPRIIASSYSGVFTIGGSTIENTNFSASPTSGAAPLYVVFRTNTVNDLSVYTIDFGDGTSGTWQNNCAFGYGACGLPTATHTYTTAGTYTARLFKNTCPAGAQCFVGPLQVAAVTITVGGSTGGGTPSISGLDAPTSLAVGQTGTWTVRLNTTNTGNLSYSVVWGDEGWGMTPVNAQYGAPAIAASGSFTHAYQTAGTFSPRFTVSNSSGSAQTSASVTVGGTLGRSCVYNGQTYAEGTIVPFYPYDGYTNQSASAIPASAMKMADVSGYGSAMMPITNYVRYRCTNGDWVRAYDEYVNPCPNCVVALKPVIYLYPVATQEVAVNLKFNGQLSSTYPAYNPVIGGWRVIAHPDGTLQNIADNREYSYLFWEGENYPLTIDETKGFVVKGSEAQAFLQTKLAALGLTPREYNEFIVFWLPKMEHNPYNFVQFVGSEYVNLAPLSISPKPDSVLRVFMALKPLKEAVSVTPQVIQPFERKGFSVIEWGGTELR